MIPALRKLSRGHRDADVHWNWYTAPGTPSVTSRSRRSAIATASSARLRSSMSALVPVMRMARPFGARSVTMPCDWIHL